MTLKIIIFLGFFILFLNLIIRFSYRLLPSKMVLIKNIHLNERKNNSLLVLKGEMGFNVGSKSVTRRLQVIETKKNENKYMLLQKSLNDLQGKEVRYYYIPIFERFGYFDLPCLLGPIWPRIAFLLIYLIPMLSIFFFA